MNPEKATRCVVAANAELDANRNIIAVPEMSSSRLNSRQIDDYEKYRIDFMSWLLNFGKDPSSAKGYSPYTVYADSQRTAAFDRWVWESHGRYTIPPDESDANAYFEEVAISDRSEITKGKIEESLTHYGRWLAANSGGDPWELDYSFDSSGGWKRRPKDYLRREERRAVREVALNYGGDSWKFTSLVWAGLDAGLRPAEVMRAKTYWVDKDNHILRIPAEDDTKGEGNWETSITDRTHRALIEWLDERAETGQYDGTDTLWLTRRGNPYASKSLGRLLRRLCEEAGIDTTHRHLPWYAIRHSVGTLMSEERGLKAAKDQLRHMSPRSTMKYDQVSNETREEVLNRMG